MQPDFSSPKGIIGNPYDLAKQIGEGGIHQLLELVCRAYSSLLASNTVSPGMMEDEISEELFKELQIIWRTTDLAPNLVPIREKADTRMHGRKGKSPTIDFCLRDRWVRKAYFGFECKRLVENDRRLCDEYINNGLRRYLTGKYSSPSSEGSLIGYVSGALDVVIHEVTLRVDKEKAISKMVVSFALDGFKEHYESSHQRNGGLSSFRVHHLFFCFEST